MSKHNKGQSPNQQKAGAAATSTPGAGVPDPALSTTNPDVSGPTIATTGTKYDDGPPPKKEEGQVKAEGQLPTPEVIPAATTAPPASTLAPVVTETIAPPQGSDTEKARMADEIKRLQDLVAKTVADKDSELARLRALEENRVREEAKVSKTQNGNGKHKTTQGKDSKEKDKDREKDQSQAETDDPENFRTIGTVPPTNTTLGRADAKGKSKRELTPEEITDALNKHGDKRVSVRKEDEGAPRDRKPTVSLRKLLVAGFKEAAWNSKWLETPPGGAIAVDLFARARGFVFGFCENCASGIRPIGEPHWHVGSFKATIPLPPGETELDKTRGVCIGQSERGQVATQYILLESAEFVYSRVPFVPDASCPGTGVVIYAPQIPASHVLEVSARDLNRYFRHLLANTVGSDSPEVIPLSLDWEPVAVKYDMSGMSRPRKREVLDAEIGTSDVTDYVGQMASLPPAVARQLAAFGVDDTRITGHSVGLYITADANGALVITPVPKGDPSNKSTIATRTIASDHKPLEGEVKTLPLPSEAMVDPEALARYEKLLKNPIVMDPVVDDEITKVLGIIPLEEKPVKRDEDGSPSMLKGAQPSDDWDEQAMEDDD